MTIISQDALESKPLQNQRLIDRIQNPFWLAPMAGITEICFRQLMDEMDAGLLVSELVSAKGLIYNSQKTRQMMGIHPRRKSLVGVQLFGETAEDMAEAARIVEEEGADFVDVNLGCPVKKVVKKGCGAALLREPARLERYLSEIQRAISLPLTVKMRTGWDQHELTIHDCVKAAQNAGCEWAAIHGRTRAQGYDGFADWELIARVKAGTSLPIIGNGDIRDAETARQRLRESGVDAVMIGRGALRNPWIFRECLGRDGRTPEGSLALIRRFQVLLEDCYDLRHILLNLRKFAVWLAFGYPGAAAFRGNMFRLHSTREVVEQIEEFFTRAAAYPIPVFANNEAFMMGGHG
ncbi:MAG: tRNA dihydrouridine synthase DusB [Candidatus Nitrohelix vancouverensis]|uniref:tRNA-dihydrouridine synthase n=1 Tax=Candidatus Nitrohelix vancouverensis TaxID=2705534 RepID=A0A7T0C0V5_9BACT|nr:MAG: tRNA dihydrouridine synthase DusB [Candidatus Nitrohelix vancouverensis]